MPVPIEQVFAFFSDEENLERLTPPWLNFQVMRSSTTQIQKGTLIDYQLRLRGVSVKWCSSIDEWQPNTAFVDRQVRGPYTYWHHYHHFQPMAGGTLVEDHVRYSVPGGKLGDLLVAPFVARDLSRIFKYRQTAIAKIFALTA